MKQLLSPRFQRVAIVVLMILLQLATFIFLITQFSQYFLYVYWFCVAFSFFTMLLIANSRSKLPYKIAWIIPILLFPLLGGLVFFLMGGARKPDKRVRQRMRDTFGQQLSGLAASPQDLMPFGVAVSQQSRYLENAASCPPFRNTQTQYFPTGDDFYPVLLEKLQTAQEYIFLEYFIIAEGRMWAGILDILKEKVARGLDVRIIYDDLGSVVTLPRSFPEEMRSLGISCAVFRPVRPILSVRQNNRDHRKVCVIDGTVGFVGGINLADEYINAKLRFGYWKDSALLLQGEGVWSLTVLFLQMWESITNQETVYRTFYPEHFPAIPPQPGFVQPYFDTPLPSDTIGVDLHIQMFSKAQHYLYITTPYLVIDDTIASAILISARSGVDVRIMTPHIPDKKSVFHVTQSHYEELLQAGVRIFEYLPGFIHSKSVVADDLYASVGSCNLDYRSFYLQYENGVWLCGDPSVLALRDDFLKTLPLCKEIHLEDCLRVSFPTRLLRSLLRIFSPLF